MSKLSFGYCVSILLRALWMAAAGAVGIFIFHGQVSGEMTVVGGMLAMLLVLVSGSLVVVIDYALTGGLSKRRLRSDV